MILFVDDESRYSRAYREELELSGYEVAYEKGVDSARRFFEENFDRLELLILDIMMPPGTTFRHDDTDFGLRTGVYFFELVRRQAPDLPVIILTNVSDPAVESRFREERNCRYLQKQDVLPFQIIDEVRELLPALETQERGEK